MAVLCGLVLLTREAQAQDHIYFSVECKGGLKSAQGVIGLKHGYTFHGQCVLWQMRRPEDNDEMKALLEDGETAWHDKALVTFNAEGKASWDRASGSSKESLGFQGPVSGQVVRSATCVKDPFLEEQPICSAISGSQNVTAGPHLDRLATALYQHNFFFFWNQFSLAEAQALSAGHGKGAIPPPPEPKAPPVIAKIDVTRIIIGKDEHVVRVTLRGARPIMARLSRSRALSHPIVLEDPGSGASQRTAALRISSAAVQRPGILTISLNNKHGRAQAELLACSPGGVGNPRGCPLSARQAGPTAVAPVAPVAPAKPPGPPADSTRLALPVRGR